MINIQSIKAYSDNYIWLITTNEGNLVIDPGESQPVINYLQKHTLTLTDILITHHHFDHVGGVLDLKKNILGDVTGPLNHEIEGLDNHVTHGMEIESCGLKFEVIEIPGHTLDHIAYFLNDRINRDYFVVILSFPVVAEESLKELMIKCMNL